GAVLSSVPLARHGGYAVALAPAALILPWAAFEEARPGLDAGAEYQRRQVPLVEAALGRMARHAPAAFARFAAGMRVVSLTPPEYGVYNSSSSEFPGACTMVPV